MRKKDHGKPENDDQLWEIVTRQVNPLKSARYAGVTKKAGHSREPVAPRDGKWPEAVSKSHANRFA